MAQMTPLPLEARACVACGVSRAVPCAVERRMASLGAAFDLAPLPGFLFNVEEGAFGEGGVKKLHAAIYSSTAGITRVLDCPPRRWRLLVTPAPPAGPSSPDCRACILVEAGRRSTVAAFTAFDEYGLTPAQRRIVELLIEGLTNNQIGKRLGIAGETVRKQVARILAKTSMPTRTALVSLVLMVGDLSGS